MIDTNYIIWLEEFTKKHPNFSNDTWLYCPEKISKEDYNMVVKLPYFFGLIQKYAEKNFIKAGSEDSGFYEMFYQIKFNNVGYKIGLICGQGAFNYCCRYDNAYEKFIDFNDIINSKKQDNVDVINEKLEQLSKLVNELIELEVPESTIIGKVEKCIFSNNN